MGAIAPGRKAAAALLNRGHEMRLMPPIASAYFVYVLRNRAGTLYTGIAKDVSARCDQHNDGCGARFTRGRGPWSIAHVEGPYAHGDALRREIAIKRDRKLKAALKKR